MAVKTYFATKARFGCAVCAVLASYAIVVEIQFACGGGPRAPSFTHLDRPDTTFEQYVKGDLGIVKPGFRHAYLFFAYRHLAGLGFPEQADVEVRPTAVRAANKPRPPRGIDLWESALGRSGTTRKHDWRFARRQVPGSEWQFFLNCPDHAFRTAAATLDERAKQFGSGSEEVKAWVEAQDIVFSNCQNGEDVPAEASADLDPLIRADRAYQIAAAHFYAGHFDQAATRFLAIGDDNHSPWRSWGTYLAARSWIRKGTLEAPPYQIDDESFAEALKLLEAVLDDPDQAKRHAAAEGLRGFVEARLRPTERLDELAELLLQPDPGTAIDPLWSDYHYLLDRGHGRGLEDDLTQWMLTFSVGGKDALDRSVGHWKQAGSLPWLVAVLTKIDSDHADLDEVLKAAAAVPETSPGRLTASYYRFRLLADLGRAQELRGEVDELLDTKLPAVSRNQFLALRLPLAQSFDEFLRFAPRASTGEWYYGKDSTATTLLDRDSLQAFNARLPLTLLEQAARSESIPVPVRAAITLVTWVRAGLIDEVEIQRRLTPLVKQHWPTAAPDLDRFAAATDPVERKQAFLYAVLRHPGSRPVLRVSTVRRAPVNEVDAFRDNWWCGMEETLYSLKSSWEQYTLADYRRRNPGAARTPDTKADGFEEGPAFLDESERSELKRQIDKLKTIETGPNYLSAQTIQWAKEAPNDPRVPEALHHAVRTTRFGCVDEDTTEFSKAAFQLLHRRYPNSEWAKKTKYWY